MPSGIIFNHETVALDGEHFSDCQFRSCRLTYNGGDLPTLEDCRFEHCEWKFDGAAARTLAHLKLVWGAGGKVQVQALIKEVTGSGR